MLTYSFIKLVKVWRMSVDLIMIKSKIRTTGHCLRLDHDTMACVVSLAMFLWSFLAWYAEPWNAKCTHESCVVPIQHAHGKNLQMIICIFRSQCRCFSSLAPVTHGRRTAPLRGRKVFYTAKNCKILHGRDMCSCMTQSLTPHWAGKLILCLHWNSTGFVREDKFRTVLYGPLTARTGPGSVVWPGH